MMKKNFQNKFNNLGLLFLIIEIKTFTLGLKKYTSSIERFFNYCLNKIRNYFEQQYNPLNNPTV